MDKVLESIEGGFQSDVYTEILGYESSIHSGSIEELDSLAQNFNDGKVLLSFYTGLFYYSFE